MSAKLKVPTERGGTEGSYLAFPEELWLSENTVMVIRDAQPRCQRQLSPPSLHSTFKLTAVGWKHMDFGV